MVRYFLFVVLLFSVVKSSSQNILIKTNSENEAPKIYRTYYNALEIVVEGYNCDSLTLKSNELSIEKQKSSRCAYYVRAKSSVNVAYLYVYSSQNLIDSSILFVEDNVPLPIVKRFGKETEHEILNRQFDSLYCISPFQDLYNKGVKFTILSFIVEIVHDGRVRYSEYIQGHILSKAFKDNFFNVRPLDKVILRSIAIRSDDGAFHSIPYREFRFK